MQIHAASKIVEYRGCAIPVRGLRNSAARCALAVDFLVPSRTVRHDCGFDDDDDCDDLAGSHWTLFLRSKIGGFLTQSRRKIREFDRICVKLGCDFFYLYTISNNIMKEFKQYRRSSLEVYNTFEIFRWSIIYLYFDSDLIFILFDCMYWIWFDSYLNALSFLEVILVWSNGLFVLCDVLSSRFKVIK